MAIPAAQAQLNMDQGLMTFLMQSLNFSVALCNCLSFDGYDTTPDFVDWTYSDISNYCKDKSGRTQARGGTNWPDRKKKDLQGFAFYVTQRALEGTQVDVTTLDNGVHVLTLRTVREYYEAARVAEDKGDEVDMKKPDVLKSEDWVQWEKSVIHYLNNTRNRKGVPLSYVIRGDTPPQNIQLTDDEQMIWAAALQGPQFVNDSKQVYGLVKELVQNTDGDNWLPVRCSCGRQAMVALRSHYDGPDQAKARVDVARACLEKLFYKNEHMLSFESYSTEMKKSFDTLEKYHQPEYESNKIDKFLKGIRNENNKVVNVVSIARTRNDLDTFQLVQEFLSNQLKSIFPPKEVQPVPKKPRRVAAAQRRKKAAKRRARIAKISITGRKENGVQLRGYEHFYSRKDFEALNKDTRAAILQARKDNNFVPGENNGRNIDAVEQANGGDDVSQLTSLAGRTITMDRSLIAGVMAATRTNQESTPPSNGSHVTPSVSSTSSKVRVTYDAAGNICNIGEDS